MKVKIIKCSGFTIKPIKLDWERIPGYSITGASASANLPLDYDTIPSSTTSWTSYTSTTPTNE